MTEATSKELDQTGVNEKTLRKAIRGCMSRDRFRFSRQLKNIEQRRRKGKPVERDLLRLVAQTQASEALVAARSQLVSPLSFPEALPVSARRKICAHNFGVGKFGALQIILFAIKANANAVAHPTTTARALISAGLGNRFNRQALYLRAIAVTANTRITTINDVANTGYS